MGYDNTRRTVSDEDRREFLKALGIGGGLTAGGATLQEVREEMAAHDATESSLAPIGRKIRADLTGAMDVTVIADGQAAVATAADEIPTAVEKGFPVDGPRHEFGAVAEAGRPVYEHLLEAGFFESTTEHLPPFTPERLVTGVETFVGSERLQAPLEDLAFAGEEGVDLLAAVVSNAEQLSNSHWIATDELSREQLEIAKYTPPMTQGAAGGALLWLRDLDRHLWQQRVLLTEVHLERAAWYGRSMAAGFALMTEGARRLAAESGELSEAELGALLSVGFAVQAISQGLLPEAVYWITDDVRAEREADDMTVIER